ncbi:MAG: MFS transporter [Anaerolineae bacterium]|nr:MFS transporter [Anaerolineae bacterium]
MVENKSLKEEFVPLKSRIWVSIADAACAMLLGLSVNGSLTYYFTRVRGLEPGRAAFVWILFGIWNAVNDPLFGYISDRTKSGLGRRIPYIRYGAPIYVLGFIAFWINWPGESQTWLFIQLLLSLFVFDSLYTAIATSIYVMPFEMAISNKARSSILVWKIIFSVLPLAVPLVALPLLQPGPGDNPLNFQIVMTLIGLLMGALIFISTYFYEEKHYHQEEEQLPFFTALKECFTNRSFLLFETISFTVIYAQTSLMQGVLYYFDEIEVAPVPIYIGLALGIVIGLIVFIRQRETWGVKLSMRIMSLIFAIACFIVLAFGREVLAAAIGFFGFGIGFSGAMYLVPLMNGDVVDMDEHRTQLRREGMYAGVNSFITKPAISMAQAVFLWFLDSYGYDPNLAKGMQSVSAESGLLMGWMLVPGVLLALCFVLLRWYPLAGEEWAKIKAQLGLLHAEKEREHLLAEGYQVVD